MHFGYSWGLVPRARSYEIGSSPMSTVLEQILFATALALVAAAYAAVGQGGATGYIALMGLVGFDAEVIRTTALTLDLLVSTLGLVLFARAGLLKPRNVY